VETTWRNNHLKNGEIALEKTIESNQKWACDQQRLEYYHDENEEK